MRASTYPALFGALVTAAFAATAFGESTPASLPVTSDARTLQAIYADALVRGQAYENLAALVANCPGRLAGSPALDRAVDWAHETLNSLPVDRVYLQDVKVPHWVRGEPESVTLVDAVGTPSLAACAVGNSAPTPPAGVLAEVVEVQSLAELATLGRPKLEGKIVFFNRPMNPTIIIPGQAYGDAGDQRFHGPAEAAKYGAVGALVRSLTFRHDDTPHTGVTKYEPGTPPIPAAALSLIAADRLSAAVAEGHRDGTPVRVAMKINSRWLPDAPSHNVIAEIRGRELPDQVIVVGGHLDSWDIAPGAHDDGAGVVQSIEVLQIFHDLGLKPRHTIRCVLFVNEENGLAGAIAYANAAKSSAEKHVFALETDAGGFEPHGFSFESKDNHAAERAEAWLPLFRPFGTYGFRDGNAGSDVEPLLDQTGVVAELTPDSQRYFDIHHTVNDRVDQVNPRELHLGAAALASLIWLVDQHGI